MMGLIQSGYVDTFAEQFGYLNRFDDFASTMPVDYGSVYALMLRPTSPVHIYSNSVFPFSVYALIVAAVLTLCACEYLNEQRHLIQIDENVNKSWAQLHSLIPFNATWWMYQDGVTRKVHIMTGSIALLLLLTYYQCNLLHHLLIPKPAPMITVSDIAQRVHSHKAKLLFHRVQSLYEKEIMATNVSEITSLAAAIQVNQPLYGANGAMDKVTRDNAIIIDRLDNIYADIINMDPNECANYAIVEVPLTSIMSVIFLNKRRSDVVERLNKNIAQRLEYLLQINDKDQPHEICLRHIMSNNPPEPSYVPLHLRSLSASFVFLLFFLSCAVLIFGIELVVNKMFTTRTKEQQHLTPQYDEVNMCINLRQYSPNDRQVIIANCQAFLDGFGYLKLSD
jgi:hypothetical protein